MLPNRNQLEIRTEYGCSRVIYKLEATGLQCTLQLKFSESWNGSGKEVVKSVEFFRKQVGTFSGAPTQTLSGLLEEQQTGSLANKKNTPSRWRDFSLPSRLPGDRSSQELFHSPLQGPGGRRLGFAEGQRWPRSAEVWKLAASLSALFLLSCYPETRYRSLRSKLSRKEAMEKSKGRLYLWMCLAAALASFLAGFLVGKCPNPFPLCPGLPLLRTENRVRQCWLHPPAELSRGGELREFQPNWKPNGMLSGTPNKV